MMMMLWVMDGRPPSMEATRLLVRCIYPSLSQLINHPFHTLQTTEPIFTFLSLPLLPSSTNIHCVDMICTANKGCPSQRDCCCQIYNHTISLIIRILLHINSAIVIICRKRYIHPSSNINCNCNLLSSFLFGFWINNLFVCDSNIWGKVQSEEGRRSNRRNRSMEDRKKVVLYCGWE